MLRVQIQQQHQQSPLVQQQIRSIDTVTSPRNQIEAMPPNTTPPPLPLVFNPATMHPVFFMNNWRKTPFPLPINPAVSPVAAGYVFPIVRPNSVGGGNGTKL